jgi:hypothetical protein
MQTLRFSIAATILLCAPAIAQVANAPCFEANLGTNLNLNDDQVSGAQALGFTFPGPSGPVTSIWVSSNGFIWLAASTNSRCCSGEEGPFLANPASIAGMWIDLYPPGGTGVFFNAIPASGSAPARGVVTWMAVPEFGAQPTAPAETIQVQLLSTGEIVISHDLVNNIDRNTDHTALIGVTQGNGATANPIDFKALAGSSVNTGSNPTAYEVFGPDTYDVGGRSYEFLPNGLGGYLVLERMSCRQADTATYGTGCPRNGTVYEAFVNNVDLANTSVRFVRLPGTGYLAVPGGGWDSSHTSVLPGVGDDSIHQGLALGFSFPFGGTTVTTVDLSSNGYLWCATNPGSFYYARIIDFLQQDRRIAPFWRDLYAPGGGQLYWDVTPSFAMATWVNVPNYPLQFPANPGNNVQVKLFANGDIEFSYGSVDPLNVEYSEITLVGFSEGNNAADPGNTDLSASVPGLMVGVSGEVPLKLDAAAGSRPRINTTFTMDVSSVPASATFGFMVLSFGQIPTGVDLSIIGFPSTCAAYVNPTGAAIIGFGMVPPTGTFALGIPNDVGLVTQNVYAQTIAMPVFSAPFPAIVSNGLVLMLGL